MIHEVWNLNQQNLITFVMVDPGGNEVSGLGGAGITIELNKNGLGWVASAGLKGEMGNGWYRYLASAAEANTVGTVSIRVNAVGCRQQNLEYIVKQRNPNAIEYTYTVTDGVNPIEGVEVWFSTDIAGNNIVFKGYTDAFGIVLDEYNQLPWLDPGTYYVWSQKVGWSFVLPDTEVVS